MTTIATVRVSGTKVSRSAPQPRGKRFQRRERVEAGIILAAFAIALGFMSAQQTTTATDFSWTTVQATSVNETLSVGEWVQLGQTANLSDNAIYQFCVTTLGAGTMLMEPSQLISSVVLTGDGPVTTCADTHDIRGVSAVLPSVTVADGASAITVIESSWQRLETIGN